MADIRSIIEQLGSGDPAVPIAQQPILTTTVQPGLIGTPGAPAILSPNRPLFDYSRLREVPNVPQQDLPRYVPPRGVPEETQRIADPQNIARLNEVAGRGAMTGGLEWYNLEPLRRRFVEELGADKGNKQFMRYLELISATSPQTKVPENVRNASYYLKALTQGEPIPERIKRGRDWTIKKGTQAPYPYSQTLPLHIQNIENILRHGSVPPLQNPKPASFVQNLAGNQRPVTIDTHNMRMLFNDPNRELPNPNQYGFLERMQQQEAAKMGMTPAQYQASLWVGGAEQTGVRSGVDPALRHIERRIEKTATEQGKTKEQVLKEFIRGIAPLSLNDVLPYLASRNLA